MNDFPKTFEKFSFALERNSFATSLSAPGIYLSGMSTSTHSEDRGVTGVDILELEGVVGVGVLVKHGTGFASDDERCKQGSQCFIVCNNLLSSLSLFHVSRSNVFIIDFLFLCEILFLRLDSLNRFTYVMLSLIHI